MIHKEKYIKINDEVTKIESISKEMTSNDNSPFILSLLGKYYEKRGTKINVLKKKEESNQKIEVFSIQSLFSLIDQKKYELHFDFDQDINQKILNNPLEKEKFIESWRKKLSQKLNINPNNIVFRDIHHERLSFYISIINEKKEYETKLKELKNFDGLKKVEEKPMLEFLQISSSILDPKGDRYKNYSQNAIRGGEKYIPPNDWYGIGLNVENMYDNGNNDWLSSNNINGEFAVAYFGINNSLNDFQEMVEELNSNIESMMSQKLYRNEKDLRNPNLECGDGVCVFQNPQFAENGAGILDILGYRIKILLMCRVNPKKIRQPANFKDCWILNPTPDEIRPYRILIKKIPISPLTLTNELKIITSTSPVNYIISAIQSNDFSFNNLKKDNFLKRIAILNGQIVNDDFFAIRLYSSIYFRYINPYLRTKEKISLNGLKNLSEEEIKSWICCLQLALSRNINVKEDTVVYRGVNLKFPPEIGIGSKFYFREFISTTTKEEFAKNWIKNKGTIMIIKIKNNGTNGHKNYCYYIEDITISKHQFEVLLSSHCFFTVTNIKHEKDIDYVYLTCEGSLFCPIQENNFNEANIYYKIDSLKKIKLFGKSFVEKNKNNCKIIFNDQEYELNVDFDINNIVIGDNILKIKLKETNNITDMSYMF